MYVLRLFLDSKFPPFDYFQGKSHRILLTHLHCWSAHSHTPTTAACFSRKMRCYLLLEGLFFFLFVLTQKWASQLSESKCSLREEVSRQYHHCRRLHSWYSFRSFLYYIKLHTVTDHKIACRPINLSHAYIYASGVAEKLLTNIDAKYIQGIRFSTYVVLRRFS